MHNFKFSQKENSLYVGELTKDCRTHTNSTQTVPENQKRYFPSNSMRSSTRITQKAKPKKDIRGTI
jgi:hypothetical protein